MKKWIIDKMKNKWLFTLTSFLVLICVYGPNMPSASFTYSPKVPEEIKKLRNE
jgi:hypothetical protein